MSYLKSLSSSHDIIGNSDLKIAPLRGRPFGGRAFIVRKTLDVQKHSFVNKHISYISFTFYNSIFSIISVYLPFDNNSYLNFSEFRSNLQIIKELYDFFSSKNHSVFIFGDFNADLKRNNRFDFEFINFLNHNNFCYISPSLDVNEFSYSNGEYKATLDHCIISTNEWNLMVSCSFLDDVINLSDHKPVQIRITFDTMCSRINYEDKIDNTDEFETINLPPNLDNIEMCKKFNRVLIDQMRQYDNLPIDNFSDKQNIINRMYQQLSSSIRFAFDSCSSTTSINKLKKKRWFTNELKIIRNKMVTVRHKVDKNQNDIVELKSLKKDFKKL